MRPIPEFPRYRAARAEDRPHNPDPMSLGVVSRPTLRIDAIWSVEPGA